MISGAFAGNEELEYYTNSSDNAFIRNQQLIIKVIKEQHLDYYYTSAQLVTRQAFQYGFVSVKAKVPKVYGQLFGCYLCAVIH